MDGKKAVGKLAHAKNNNYGPDRTLPIKWQWSFNVKVKPGQRVLFRFSFSAWFENAVMVYSLPRLDTLAERGNYARSLDDYEFKNNEAGEVELLVTGWHKPSPPDADEPWFHSPKYKHQGTPQVEIVGFADDQGRDGSDNPDLFRNALVSVVYF